MRTRKEIVLEMSRKMKDIYRLGEELGHSNILEKAKWKEEVMGLILGDRVFSKSTGEVKGADAVNEETGEYREYKTEELKSVDKERFLESVVDGTTTFAGSMTYNGAGGTGDDLGKKSREIVNSYKDFGHYHGVFHRGEVVSVTRVDTDYVTSDDGLMKRIIKEETGTKYSSTNGNGVGVHYENGGVREGEGKVVYINDIRK
tara:strand:- start:400 stop:1005 length:606 start_codon:yes stop_codon:yes gene_type:complete